MERFIIESNAVIRSAMKKLDDGGQGFLAILKDGSLFGIITDGDIRRAILHGVDLTAPVETIANTNFISVTDPPDRTKIEEIFRNTKARHLPVLRGGQLVDVIFETSFLLGKENDVPAKERLTIPLVVMAGGKGTRMDPFTKILPKALIPIGEKPIIEIILDEFARYGVNEFYISVNHKARMIKSYFDEHESGYAISYIEEQKPLGTAGALRSLLNNLHTEFFVSNCDILIRDDYTRILEFHRKNGFLVTIVGSMLHHTLPYGVCEIEKGGILKTIVEKPEYDILVNTGMYIVNREALSAVPKDTYFDMTDLIGTLQRNEKKIGVYPVSQKSWVDIGQWEEYQKAVKAFSL